MQDLCIGEQYYCCIKDNLFFIIYDKPWYPMNFLKINIVFFLLHIIDFEDLMTKHANLSIINNINGVNFVFKAYIIFEVYF